MPHLGHALNPNSNATPGVATEKHVKLSNANDWPQSAQAQPVVAAGSPPLKPRAPGRAGCQSNGCTPGTAQRATPSSQSGAAAAEYGSRFKLVLATETSTADRWTSSRRQRGAGGARWAFSKTHTTSGLPEARPNPSLKLTRYGRRCKPGLSQRYHRLRPGLQHLPTRAA